MTSAERARRWREKNRDRANESRREWYARNRETRVAYMREWRDKNREKVRDYHREYQRQLYRDPEARAKLLAYASEQYWSDPETYRARANQWAKDNPVKANARTQRRKARLMGSEGSYTGEEFAQVCADFGQRCAYCDEQTNLTVDHVIPLIRGGSNHIDNIVPACRSCNSRKRTRTADEYLLVLIGEEN